MKNLVAVVELEVGRHRRTLAAALVLGLIAVLLPWLEGRSGAAAAEVRNIVAGVGALLFAGFIAAALGWSGFAAEQASGRLRFYFARPIAGGTLWAGRLLATLLIVWGAAIGMLLPATLFDLAAGRGGAGGPLSELWPGDGLALAGLAAVALALLVLLANAVSLLGRTRSLWSLLDFAGGLAVAALVASALDRLRGQFLDDAALRTASGLAIALLIGLVCASAVQVIAGRCDLRRAHRLAALTLWGLLGLAAAGGEVYSRWYVNPEPTDFAAGRRYICSAPSGDWLWVAGDHYPRAEISPTFLLDGASGRWHRLGLGADTELDISSDGRSAVWLGIRERERVPLRLDLGAGDAEPQTILLGERLAEQPMALSSEGRRLAARPAGGRALAVYDLSTGKALSRVELVEPAAFTIPSFTATGRLFVFQLSLARPNDPTDRVGWIVFELDPERNALVRLGELTESLSAAPPRVDARGERLLFQRPYTSPTGSTVDGPTLLVRLAPGLPATLLADGAPLRQPSFLPDGRLLWVARDAGGRELHLADANGVELRSWPFPGAAHLAFGHLVDGDLLLSTSEPGSAWSTARGWRTWRVALAGPTPPQLVGEGLRAVGTWTYGSLRTGPPLVLDEHGAVLRLDRHSATRTTVLAPG